MSPARRSAGSVDHADESWGDPFASDVASEQGTELPPGAALLGGRFVIVRRLGRGGMGVVYEVFDRDTKSQVALKMLSHGDGPGIYRFKQEFRAFADVRHENLMPLHELFAEDGRWFFTMDVVEGQTFLEHVRSGAGPALADTLVLGSSEQVAETARPPVWPSQPALDAERLRAALVQLVAGVKAIHAAGKLHRDVKSSNVLVTPEGRVVILDFGLVGEKTRDEATAALEQEIAGTPAYMAPEQVSGEPETTASDWYAVGAMLYEALCGSPPFVGGASEVMRAKVAGDPQPVSERAPSAPADLAELCMRLLCRTPAARPGGGRNSPVPR